MIDISPERWKSLTSNSLLTQRASYSRILYIMVERSGRTRLGEQESGFGKQRVESELNRLRYRFSCGWLIELPRNPAIVEELLLKQEDLARRRRAFELAGRRADEMPVDLVFQGQILDKLLTHRSVTADEFGFHRYDFSLAGDSVKPRYEEERAKSIEPSPPEDFVRAWRLIQLYTLNGTEKVDRVRELQEKK